MQRYTDTLLNIAQTNKGLGKRARSTVGKSVGRSFLAGGGVGSRSSLRLIAALPGFLGWCSGYKFTRRAVRQILVHPLIPVAFREQVMVIPHNCRMGYIMVKPLRSSSSRPYHRCPGSLSSISIASLPLAPCGQGDLLPLGAPINPRCQMAAPEELSQKALQTCVLKGELGLRTRG